jgi:nitrogen regulatory protein PII
VAFYARPRYTKDIDILIEPDIRNGEKIVKALNEFGFESCCLSSKDFIKKGSIIQLGYEPVRVDIITSIPKVDFKEIWKNKKSGKYGDEKIFFVGLKDLIKIKKISKRKQDKVDIKILTQRI